MVTTTNTNTTIIIISLLLLLLLYIIIIIIIIIIKFSIPSYFAQITSIVSYFRKYHSKVLKRFIFFEIQESSKNAILALGHLWKWSKIIHLFSLVQINTRTSVDVIWSTYHISTALSKTLLQLPQMERLSEQPNFS